MLEVDPFVSPKCKEIIKLLYSVYYIWSGGVTTLLKSHELIHTLEHSFGIFVYATASTMVQFSPHSDCFRHIF